MAFASDNLGNDKALSLASGSLYRFGPFVLDSRRRTLSRADSPVFLTPKAFDVLMFLVQNPQRLVTKDELLQAVWADTFVEEGNLTQYISHLRKALGDNSEGDRLIITIARRGYQFTANVSVGVTAEDLGPDTRPVQELPVNEALPKPRPSRKAVVVGALATVLLVVAGFVSWRHFGLTTQPGSPKIMLAVLPFENLTGDPNKEYLADSLTEEMISQLGRLNPERLGVIARTSVMGYKHKDERLDQIGRDLAVQYVVESSLRESGDHVRLTAQLIQVKDQTHLWSQDYDYGPKDILTVEDDVARTVARQIQLRLTWQQEAEFAKSHTVNPEAFDAYLHGYYFFERNTDKDTDMAAKYYERATQLDPSYALAWAGLSRVRKWQATRGLIPAEEGYRLAREAVERALTLNPKLADAHIQMFRMKEQVDLDFPGAQASAQRAIALEPWNPEMLDVAGASAIMSGRLDEALQLARRAVDLDPLNAGSWEALGDAEYYFGDLDKAAADTRKALELNPDAWPGDIQLSKILVIQGRPQDALPRIQLVRYANFRVFLYTIAYYALGREKESDAALSELIAKYPDSPYLIAAVYAFRNQSDQAFEWLDRSYTQRDSGLIQTKVDPLLKSLHRDPRYAALVKKLNFPG